MEDNFEFQIKLLDLEMVNFRGFSEAKIAFHPNLTVIIGENGTGKTTVIDAAAGLLTVLVDKIKNQPVKNIPGFDAEKDILVKNGITARTAINTINVSINGQEIKWFGSLTPEGYSPEEISNFSTLDKLVSQLNDLLGSGEQIMLPIIVYYPCYAALEEPSAERKLKVNPFQTYDNALSGKPFEIWNFLEWYKGHENRAKEKADSKKIIETIREAIHYFLSDDSNKFNNLKTDYEDLLSGELVIYKNNEKLKINQLSSGERTLFFLVADMARRITLANPQNDSPLNGNGIVLIDEIDLHLHPRWQQKVIRKLRETFPNIQFIVTTHSPLVLQGVHRENIRVLENGVISDDAPFVHGRDPNAIIEDAFSVGRPAEIEQKIEEISRLIDEENEAAAKEKLKELKKIWGEDDREIQRLTLHTELI